MSSVLHPDPLCHLAFTVSALKLSTISQGKVHNKQRDDSHPVNILCQKYIDNVLVFISFETRFLVAPYHDVLWTM